MQVLNNRQENILKDLESTDTAITAKSLSAKYNVSLRTIRMDVTKITEFIADKDATFIKLSGIGMRVQSKTPLYLNLEDQIGIKDIGVYSGEQRFYAILFFFLLREMPIQSEYLAEKLQLSKGTIVKEIKKINELLNPYHLEIVGKKRYGFYLKGSNIHILAYMNNLAEKIHVHRRYYNILKESDSIFITLEEKRSVTNLIDFIVETYGVTFEDRRKYFYCVLFFIKRALLGDEIPLQKNLIYIVSTNIFNDNLELLKNKIHELFGIILDESALLYFMYITEENMKYEYIWNADTAGNNIVALVRDVVDKIVEAYPELSGYHSNLLSDLIPHIRVLIYEYIFQIPSENPLLMQILSKYGDVFIKTKSILKKTKLYSYIRADDGEIGYLTVYIYKYLQMFQKSSAAKILVVCNTGRGVSRLLLSRLQNNIPEADIIGMASVYDVENNIGALDQADLIVSTVPINVQGKPVIHINSIISDNELHQIRTSLHLSEEKAHIVSPAGNVKRISSEIYAELSIEVFSLFKKIYPEKKISEDRLNNLAGMTAHVIMSYPRWADKKFVVTTKEEYDQYRQDYPREFQLIREALANIEKRFNLYIDPSEAIAILRYVI